MEISNSSIKALVEKVKQEAFLVIQSNNPYSLISTSAYDTAWLAMVPHFTQPKPMFENCLNWVLQNQNNDGFWGDVDDDDIHCLPATIACMVALKKWNVGDKMIAKGLEFIEAKGEVMIGEMYECCPRWFAIIFPAMLELAHSNGLHIILPHPVRPIIREIFNKRQQILNREKMMGEKQDPPLFSYHEALPLYSIDEEQVVKKLDNDGSLYQSPSATASAFMATGNINCLRYLQSLVQNCPNGVPATYPLDEDLINLCFINQLQKLGLAEHFDQEIQLLLEQIYRNYMKEERRVKAVKSVGQKLYKDSLAFWVLRVHGYDVSPWMFCWFLHDGEVVDQMQENHEHFSTVMLNIHRATHLTFPGEFQLDQAKSFSTNLLHKTISPTRQNTNLHDLIKHELRLPWLARLDHLEHRMWIEQKNVNTLWMGKASLFRFSSFHNDKLMQLATTNYEFRQLIYMKELKELKRWSKKWGLSEMGFGREKTTYCYFAVSASTSLPKDSDVRLMVAKTAIIITVADDFYDMEGSLHQLNHLTHAILRWDGKGLGGHSRTIFNVVDDLAREMATKHLQQQGTDITNHLRSIWYETFNSWLTEAKWSRSGYIPSVEEYIKTGMLSIAARDILLPPSCFLNPCLPIHKLNPPQLETITQLTMFLTRLLNDLQSYQKEEKEGKINFVLLHLKENPESSLEDSIAYVKALVEEKKREFLKHALMADGSTNDLPKQFRQLHLSCLKTFQMFFDSANRYDSNTEIILDIQKAIYLPLQKKPFDHQSNPVDQTPAMPLVNPPHLHSKPTKRYQTAASYHFDNHRNIKKYTVSYAAKHALCSPSRNGISMGVPIINFIPCII